MHQPSPIFLIPLCLNNIYVTTSLPTRQGRTLHHSRRPINKTFSAVQLIKRIHTTFSDTMLIRIETNKLQQIDTFANRVVLLYFVFHRLLALYGVCLGRAPDTAFVNRPQR